MMGSQNYSGYVRTEATRVMKENPKMFPSAKKISRKLSEEGISVSDFTVNNAVGADELAKHQAKWISRCGDEEIISALRNKEIGGMLKKPVKETLDKRLHTILFLNVHRLDKLGFSYPTLRKYFKEIPGLKDAVSKIGMDYREVMKKCRIENIKRKAAAYA